MVAPSILRLAACVASLSMVYGQEFATFEEFKKYTNKDSATEEEHAKRKAFFEMNRKLVDEHNIKGKHGYELKLGKFADLQSEELATMYTSGLDTGSERAKYAGSGVNRWVKGPNKDEVNWVTSGAVTGVKDQGTCKGGGWAFATTGAFEGAYFLNRTKLVSFSESQLIDCATEHDGCRGVNDYDAPFMWIEINGIATEESYPYHPRQKSCNRTKPSVASGDYFYVAGGEKGLLAAIEKQPVFVVIHADPHHFLSYSKGVITQGSKFCSSNTLADFPLLAVGYNLMAPEPYILLKNSQGVSWGEQGYLRLAVNKTSESDGVCGVAKVPTYIDNIRNI